MSIKNIHNQTNRHIDSEVKELQDALNRAQSEVNILYEISNAMRTTLNLEEILFIILTAVTAHVGLGFNRAMLFMVNENDGYIEGKIGIGPDTGEEADRIWKDIESKKLTLQNLIEAYKYSDEMLNSKLNKSVQNIKIPIREEQGLLAISFLGGTVVHIDTEKIQKHKHDLLCKVFNTKEFVIVPLRAKDKVIGLLLVDNLYTGKSIKKEDIKMLTMFANQAGLAIENSQLYEKTLIQSHMDSLTMLWNHGYFQFLLQNELENSLINKQNVSIIMFDIDNFKNYNDTYGHQIGDIVLSELAQILKNHARKQDHVCRYAGEEFIIILPLTSKQEAGAIAERLRHIIENHKFLDRETSKLHQFTVSIGVATAPEDAQDKSKLIKISDKRLYEAKRSGKNRVVWY